MKHSGRARVTGFSLIELLVSMVIGLVVTLAITSVLIRTEGSKRSSTSVNDLNQNGAYAAYALDRVIRNAGSGFSQRWNDVYGCLLDVSYQPTSSHVLPMPGGAIPAGTPFANFALPVRLMPVLIGQGLADSSGVGAEVRGDVLMVQAGTSGAGEMPQDVAIHTVDNTKLQVSNTLGYKAGDLLLLSDSNVSSGCILTQAAAVDTPPQQVITFGGDYNVSNGTNVHLTDFGTNTIALQLGNVNGNPPKMMLYGVGANSTLFSRDLLKPATATSDLPVADGVIEMRALYGVDTTGDGKLDAWVDATGAYGAAMLTDGSAASRQSLHNIMAIRLGFFLRTSLKERVSERYSGSLPDSTPPASLPTQTLTLFSDLAAPLQKTRSIIGADNLYRYRAVEVTIPLRNLLF